MDVEVELSRIIINETSDQQIIVLKERHGERAFPIVIGIVEIFAIDRRLKGITPPRPMTHDLLASVIDGLGATIDRIVIDDLRDHTFYAKIYLRLNGRTVTIDSRPSDAIALCAAIKAPIFVADHVFDKTSQ
ncbi:MAG: bifunctional nuclease family protein [Sedimentisphaerales bacterium]|jgi:bifunctional DNase/RNase|nr:bifunctional nuclease family protein [Planctomycetota bacterium]MDY0354640.1 bifunctional nuclease family protein [Sedimentisphaerales bacterium]NLT78362.1 bifunctional nuclease family protein [Planctomycetota bacterium]